MHFWRTRDGQEIDFLVEFSGKCFPVEVKMGRPDPKDLARLERIRESHWEAGQVVSLSAPAQRRAVTGEWDLVSPETLDLGTEVPPSA